MSDATNMQALLSEWPWVVHAGDGELHLWADTSYGPVCVWRRRGADVEALAAQARREVADRGGPAAMVPRG